ncbi:Six-hairpin glycosidase-like protein [Hypoxylon sp. NC1633]|nr:Six-hairpin glycosidase-like protein [Hypoxylon sp. NC1633]
MRASIATNLVAAAATTLSLFVNPAVGAAVPGVTAVIQSKHSTWMASSLMSRSQGIMTGNGGSSELLQAGITQRALSALVAAYPHDHFASDVRDYIQASAASVAPFTLNSTKDALSYPLDRLSTGNALLTLNTADANQTASLHDAADALRQSIDLNRRNAEHGLWYFVYPEWSYLDGMYSLAPFYTLYTIVSSPSLKTADAIAALDDMYYQLDLLWTHNRNKTTGLLVHGYDASRTAVWADPFTGASPHVWGRSLGWYAMALVDTLELLRNTHQHPTVSRYSDRILEKYQLLAQALVRAVDPATGGWWQILDQPGREGNYIESSGTAMFAYALLKGSQLGYLTTASTPNATLAMTVGMRAQQYLTSEFLVQEKNGTLGYNGTVAVCSLNSTATYEYYVGQPLSYNSVLGSGPYILASLEFENLAHPRKPCH